MSKSLHFFFLLLVVVQYSAFAQPSFYISVDFKFFENDKPLTPKEFDKKYIIINASKHKNKQLNYHFNPTNKTFSVGGSVVYNDLVIDIVQQKDTMQLVFKTKGSTTGEGFFDRNRLTLGLGYSFTDTIQFELTYMNEYLPRNATDKMYNVLSTTLIFNDLIYALKRKSGSIQAY